MIPPLPVVNDAIGLLAALSDPKKTKATLEEIKEHTEKSYKALNDAQAAQHLADEEQKARLREREEIGQQRLILAEQQNQFNSWKESQERTHADVARSLDERAATLDRLNTQAANTTAALVAREQAVASKEQVLNEREGQVIAKEARANALMDTLKPIMEQLR